jgi:hypothetical protein
MAKKAKEGARTDFVFIPYTAWRDIYRVMECDRCIRTGVVKVHRGGVTVLCTRSAKKGRDLTCL